jgi:hypothetical protein
MIELKIKFKLEIFKKNECSNIKNEK